MAAKEAGRAVRGEEVCFQVAGISKGLGVLWRYAGQTHFPMTYQSLLFAAAVVLLPTAVLAEVPASSQVRRLRIHQLDGLIYPIEMRSTGVRMGTVRVVLQVDSSGHLADFLIVAYTKKPFAEEVTRAVRKWKFDPEYRNGEPVDTVIQLDFDFRVDGIMLVQRTITEFPRMDQDDSRFEYEACSVKALDHIPTPVNVVKPVYLKEWADKGIQGNVVVDFYIDEQGKVRLPAVVGEADPQLAGVAVSAVEQWSFQPPTYHGRPVLVHVQQKFNFK